MPNSGHEEVITGFPPCPWCGSRFRIESKAHPGLIQCTDCKNDERICTITDKHRHKHFKTIMTVSELADLLPLDEDTIRHYAQAGKIPWVKINNEMCFDDNQMGVWLKSATDRFLGNKDEKLRCQASALGKK
jgi:hypothetical protein